MQPVLYDLENEITMEDLNTKACEHVDNKRALLCAILLTSKFDGNLKSDMQNENKMNALNNTSGDKLTIFYYNNVGMIKKDNILEEKNDLLRDGIPLLKKNERDYYNKFIDKKYEEVEKFFPACKLERQKNYLILFNPFDTSRVQYSAVEIETIDKVIEIIKEIVRDLDENFEKDKILYNIKHRLIFKNFLKNFSETRTKQVIKIIENINWFHYMWR